MKTSPLWSRHAFRPSSTDWDARFSCNKNASTLTLPEHRAELCSSCSPCVELKPGLRINWIPCVLLNTLCFSLHFTDHPHSLRYLLAAFSNYTFTETELLMKLHLGRVHPVVYIFNTDIQYIQRIYTYNLQSQPTIFSLFSLILSLHVSVPTDHLQVNHINIFVFMWRITILHRHIHFTFMLFSQLFV
jgi:hypothetical protein